MGFASHLGPWLLGTNKYTTGTTAGTIQNMGATIVLQAGSYTTPAGVSTAAPFTGATTRIAVLPAGAIIHAIIADVITPFVGASLATTLTFQTGNATTGLSTNFASGSTLGTLSGTSTLSAGRTTITPNTTNIAIFDNIGTTDLIVNLVFATAGNYTSGGLVNVQIAYAVCGSDGALYPTSFQN
jgi:hypothetical protein